MSEREKENGRVRERESERECEKKRESERLSEKEKHRGSSVDMLCVGLFCNGLIRGMKVVRKTMFKP